MVLHMGNLHLSGPRWVSRDVVVLMLGGWKTQPPATRQLHHGIVVNKRSALHLTALAPTFSFPLFFPIIASYAIVNRFVVSL